MNKIVLRQTLGSKRETVINMVSPVCIETTQDFEYNDIISYQNKLYSVKSIFTITGGREYSVSEIEYSSIPKKDRAKIIKVKEGE